MCRSKAEGGRRCPSGRPATNTAPRTTPIPTKSKEATMAKRDRLPPAAKQQLKQVVAEQEKVIRDPAATASQMVEAHIRRAHARNYAQHGSPWMTLTDLRNDLPAGLSREVVDRVLDRMIERPDVTLQAALKQSMLSDADLDAAVVIGDQPRNVLRIAIPGVDEAERSAR